MSARRAVVCFIQTRALPPFGDPPTIQVAAIVDSIRMEGISKGPHYLLIDRAGASISCGAWTPRIPSSHPLLVRSREISSPATSPFPKHPDGASQNYACTILLSSSGSPSSHGVGGWCCGDCVANPSIDFCPISAQQPATHLRVQPHIHTGILGALTAHGRGWPAPFDTNGIWGALRRSRHRAGTGWI